MDTLALQRPRYEKTATSAAGVLIAICLIFSQNLLISAKDITGITGISPTLNYIIEREQINETEFEKLIENKYKNYNISNVEKGIKHVRMVKYFNGRPVRINVVEISKSSNNNLEIEPAIASNHLASRSKVSNIAANNNAIIAINGGYFKPQTGTPLGTLMIDKKIYTGPIYDRVAMGIFNNHYEMARVQLNAKIKTNLGETKVDNINQPRMLSLHTIVYTKDWGEYSPQSPKYGIQLVVSNNKIVEVSTSPCRIPENGYVVVGPEKQLLSIINAKKLKLDVQINPEWNGVEHIISGGPYLVKNGEIFVDMTEQKLNSIGGRNPRTAIGYTKEGTLIMITADGREGESVGLTLNELANFMKSLGCVNAMNLDGGGSTVMYINGKVVNKPQMQGGIPLSHTLIVKKVS